jgi:uncharacterized membrane protein
VGDAFTWGWNKFSANVGTILLAILLYWAILVVVSVVAYFILTGIFVHGSTITYAPDGSPQFNGGSGAFASFFVFALVEMVFIFILAFLQAGIIRGALMLANGQRLEVGHMFNFSNFGTIAIAAVMVAIATGIGGLFCGVGALVVWFFTAFYLFFIVDKGQGAWESIMSSINLITSNFGKVILLLLACIGAYIVGALLCGLGLLVAVPVAVLALTYGYRKLQGDPIAA